MALPSHYCELEVLELLESKWPYDQVAPSIHVSRVGDPSIEVEPCISVGVGNIIDKPGGGYPLGSALKFACHAKRSPAG